MTLEQLLYRFLKDNGIYWPLKCQIKKRNSFNNIKINKLIAPYIIDNRNSVLQNGIEMVFYEVFKYNAIFCGDHNSKKRKYFYKLNKKWKEFVKEKFFLQHNICVGDIVEFTDCYCATRIGRILKINKNIFHIKDVNYMTEFDRTIFSIHKIEGKDIVKNIFYKSENGIDYGKIDERCNEIQL